MSILSYIQNLFNNKNKKQEKIENQHIEINEEKVEGIPMSQEEKEIVSIICGVIAANANPSSEFKVQSIVRTK